MASAFKSFNPMAAQAEEVSNNETLITQLKSVPGNFARDLVGNFNRRGRLSEKQWHWVKKLIAEHEDRVNDPEFKVLQAKIECLRNHDSSFAKSLVQQFDRNAGLSPKQWFHVDRMIKELEEMPEQDATIEPDMGQFGIFRAILNEGIESGLKKPTIVVEAYHFSFAPATGKNPGCIYVKGANTGRYMGKIDKWDRLHCGARVDGENLQRLAGMTIEDLKELMVMQGKESGSCCFCSRELTDGRSVEKGYGPVCAGRYGLPWGKK